MTDISQKHTNCPAVPGMCPDPGNFHENYNVFSDFHRSGSNSTGSCPFLQSTNLKPRGAYLSDGVILHHRKRKKLFPVFFEEEKYSAQGQRPQDRYCIQPGAGLNGRGC
jgi:hypothetical protein